MRTRSLIMKRMVLVCASISVFLLIGCSNPVNKENPVNPLPNEELARVVIPLPGTDNARAVGLSNARENTNFYEVRFRIGSSGSYTYYSANADASEDSIELSIPVGNYDVLLLAGYKKPSANYPLLLASSYALNVNIVLGQKNIINLELATIDIDINSPASVGLGEAFSAGVVINAKNPLITTFSNVTMYFTRESGWVTATMSSSQPINNVFTYTGANFTSPISVGSGLLEIEISLPALFGQAGNEAWKAADYTHLTLGQHYWKEINFISGQVMPDIEINITWPE